MSSRQRPTAIERLMAAMGDDFGVTRLCVDFMLMEESRSEYR